MRPNNTSNLFNVIPGGKLMVVLLSAAVIIGIAIVSDRAASTSSTLAAPIPNATPPKGGTKTKATPTPRDNSNPNPNPNNPKAD